MRMQKASAGTIKCLSIAHCQCVKASHKCDGKQDCDDGSDESADTCAIIADCEGSIHK